MPKLKLTQNGTMGVLADELDSISCKLNAVTTVLLERMKDEVQHGLLSVLEGLVCDLEELHEIAWGAVRRDAPVPAAATASEEPRG